MPPLGHPRLTLRPALSVQFERHLSTTVNSGVDWLDTELRRQVRRPGKRIRPALVFGAAECGPVSDPRATLACATAVELLHQSSLIHDDLMDNSATRGVEPTLHARRDPASAIVAGDYLIAAGGKLAATAGPEPSRVYHDAYARMCAGQSEELANRYNAGTTVESYRFAIGGKTAALIRASAQLGGITGGLTGDHLTALTSFGEHFGLLFQILDDLMDVLSTVELWGKPVQADVPVGTYTLPVLHAIADRGAPLTRLLREGMSNAAVIRVYAAARDTGTAATLATLQNHADAARHALATLPPSAARDDLADLPHRYLTDTLATCVPTDHRGLLSTIPCHAAS